MSVAYGSGDLNRKVRFERRPVEQDTAGQLVAAWEHQFSAWARIEQLEGRELVMAQAINTEVTHRVVIRYRPRVDTAMRVVYRERVFNVLSVVDPETEHVWLHVLCSEGPNRG